MKVSCPTCSSVVPVADVNLERLVARCGPCNTLFDVAGQLGQAPAPPLRKRAVIAPTEGYQFIDRVTALPSATHGDTPPPLAELDFTMVALKMLPTERAVLAVGIPGGALLLWVLLSSMEDRRHPMSLEFKLLMVGVFALAMATLWWARATGALTLTVKGGWLSLDFGRFRASSVAPLRVADIAQLSCTDAVGYKGMHTYTLVAIMRDGSSVPLFNTPMADAVLCVEQALEARLGIADARVPGEFVRWDEVRAR